MGILRANKVISQYIEPCTTARVNEVSKTKAVNVCFDGSLFVFTGCVESSLKTESAGCVRAAYDERLVAESSFAVLQTHVFAAQSMFDVHQILFYIDGVKPAMKRHTIEARKKNVNFSFQKAASLLCSKICRLLPRVKIVNLLLGESEHEFFTHRDYTRPNVLITDDTDLFHIAYRYAKQSKHDIVFLCKKNFTSVYDMSRVDFGMPKMLFSLVMFAKGSDFTDSLITDSMCEAVFRLFNARQTDRKIVHYMTAVRAICDKYASSEVEVQHRNGSEKYRVISLNECQRYSDDECGECETIDGIYQSCDVWSIMSYLLLALMHAQSAGLVSYRWNAVHKDLQHTASDSENYVATLTWSINYSLIGARYTDYTNDGLRYQKIHSLNFYLDVLSKNQEFDKVMFRPSMLDLKLFKNICAITLKKSKCSQRKRELPSGYT